MNFNCDVFVAGGSTGGVAAALSVLKKGYSVILSLTGKWPGGQITSQGISALDEHKLMDKSGGTSLYYKFRDEIRKYYKRNYRLSGKENRVGPFNPGCSYEKRRFSFTPRAGAEVLKKMLDEANKNNKLRILKPCEVTEAKRKGDKITKVIVKNLSTDNVISVYPSYVIDATELGDLLPLASIPYRSGIESFQETHEPDAPEKNNPRVAQAFVFPFAVEWCPGEKHIIEKPELYSELKESYRFSFNGRKFFNPGSKDCRFWTYRLILDSDNFSDPLIENDVAIICCTSMDYREDTLIDNNKDVIKKHLYRARQLALSFLYWIQTEAPRADGGKGYPGLKPRSDLMGTKDGLSQQPYIREARRLCSLRTVKEQDIVAGFNCGNRAHLFNDTVGIGWYLYVDIHWCCHSKKRAGSGQRVLPFQIPLGALIGDNVKNYIAAAKNIGTTHITNGVYRLHPVEWNTGESAGILATFALSSGYSPLQIYNNKILLRKLQIEILLQGIPVYWFDDLFPADKYFVPVQYLALEGIIIGDPEHLHFYPEQKLTQVVANRWIWRVNLRFRPEEEVIVKLRERSLSSTRGQFARIIFELISKQNNKNWQK